MGVHSPRAPQEMSSNTNDDMTLLRLGKRPVLKRNFGFVSMLGFSCTVLTTWEGILVVSTQSLLNGGPAGLIWGFLIVWVGTCSTFAVIAELSSMAPTAGGQYHWVSMLAPDSGRKVLSYITVWVTVGGWQATAASTTYLVGSWIQGLIVLNHPSLIPKPWHTMLLFWAVVFFAVLVNAVSSTALARFEGLVLVLHLIGFFAVLIPLVYFGPHGDTSIFTTFLNEGNWSTQALSFFVGLPSSVFSLIGADSISHMSEEIKNASTVVPRALMFSLLINGILGFAIVLALMFCIGDIEAALDAQETLGFPAFEIFLQAVNSTTGASIMAGIVLALGISGSVGAFAAASRMLWSFSRDRGTPFSKTLSKLNVQSSLPFYSIVVTALILMLLSLIILGSSVAFINIVSLSVVGLYSSYLLCCIFTLWRRVIGTFQTSGDLTITSRAAPGNLQWGPWHVPEPFGTINNIFACLYLIVLLFWSFWPPSTPTTPSTMNFSVLVFGAAVTSSLLWYILRGKNDFTSPVEEIDLGSFSNRV